ncbi:MAG: NAD-dependent epimerase/dehydratase family protein [Niabella sp.]
MTVAQKKILITGGTGFLGAYIIAQLLAEGNTVKAIRRAGAVWPRFMPPAMESQVDWVEGDVLDVLFLQDAMQDVDTVVHSAALVSYAPKDRRRMYSVNIEGTANVVNAAIEAGVKRMVHVSSVAAIGKKKGVKLKDEDGEWESGGANSHYAITKYHAEMEVWRGFAEGLEGVIVNPATILGYGDWEKGSCAIFKKVYDGLKYYTRGVNAFTDVEDVAKAVVALMNSNITEERFIVCNDNWPFRKLLDTIADGFGKPRPEKEASAFMANVAWRLEAIKSALKGQAPVITKESAGISQNESYFDNQKLLKALPDFHYRPLEETIKSACGKYLQDIQQH